MIRMEDALAEKKLSAQMLLQVHDELIFEVPDNEVAATLPVVQHVMQDAPFPAVLLSVPLHVDARAANNWDEAHGTPRCGAAEGSSNPIRCRVRTRGERLNPASLPCRA